MAKQKKIKIILDTNWYISASISSRSRHTLYHNIIKSNRFEIYYSDELIAEYLTVVSRKKLQKYILPNQAKRLMGFFLPKLKKTVSMPYIGVRDIKDNYLIGMCQSCEPDFLITGDADLLDIATYQNTTILNMSQFLQILPFLLV